MDGFQIAINLLLVITTGVIGVILWAKYRPRRGGRLHPGSVSDVSELRVQLGPRTSSRQDTMCAICLGDLALSCETNCGHVFCGQCITAYWRHHSRRGSEHAMLCACDAVNCPICRARVCLLLESFSAEELLESSSMLRAVHADVTEYNRRFSMQPRPLREHVRDAPVLLRHAASELFSVAGFLFMFRLRFFFVLICCIVYIASPIDLLPEAAFGLLGYIDDISVVFFFAVYVTFIYRSFLRWRTAN